MNSIHQKEKALLQLDEFGYGSTARKPDLEQQVSDNADATQGAGADGLMDGKDEKMKAFQRKQIWLSIIVSAIIIFLFVQAIKRGWIKL